MIAQGEIVKKETPIDITANESLRDAFNSISNTGKGTHFLSSYNRPSPLGWQQRELEGLFSSGIFTMLQVARKTGIERANVCRFVSEQRKENSIWLCFRGEDKLTGARAGFYTMNRDYALLLYKAATKPLWEALPDPDRKQIFKAMDTYLSDRGLGFFVSSSVSFEDDILETWHKIQAFIDERMR